MSNRLGYNKQNQAGSKGDDCAMTLEQLAFISEVEATGTIVAAARKLYVSHTTVSRAISSLEDELGFAIFDRSRKGSTLTEKGAEAIRLARIVLENVESLKQLGESEEAGTLRIGAYPVGTTSFLQDVVSRFNHIYPEYTIFLNHTGVKNIIAAVRDLELDFGLICCLPELCGTIRTSVQVTELYESELVVICSPDAPLAKKPYVTPDDLKRETFILQSEEQVLYMMQHIFFPEGMPPISMFSNNADMIKTTVRSSRMVATYVKMVVADDPLVKSGQLAFVPIKLGEELYKLKYLYIRPMKKRVSAAERTFIRLLPF